MRNVLTFGTARGASRVPKNKRNFYSALRPSVNALFGQPLALTVLNTEGVSRMSEVITAISFLFTPHCGETHGLLVDF